MVDQDKIGQAIGLLLEGTGLDFQDLFGGMPEEKCSSAFVEIGEYDSHGNAYEYESDVELLVAPDGSVWARINGSTRWLPDVKD